MKFSELEVGAVFRFTNRRLHGDDRLVKTTLTHYRRERAEHGVSLPVRALKGGQNEGVEPALAVDPLIQF